MSRSPADARAGRDYARDLAVAAPRKEAFNAISSLDGLRRWWTPRASGSHLPGGRIRLEFEGQGEHIDLDVVAARPPAALVWRIAEHTSLPDWRGTRVRFVPSERGPNACHIAFQHVGLSPALACYSQCEAGWEHFLGSLTALIELGAGWPFGHGA